MVRVRSDSVKRGPTSEGKGGVQERAGAREGKGKKGEKRREGARGRKLKREGGKGRGRGRKGAGRRYSPYKS